jgi:hypothetical protein
LLLLNLGRTRTICYRRKTKCYFHIIWTSTKIEVFTAPLHISHIVLLKLRWKHLLLPVKVPYTVGFCYVENVFVLGQTSPVPTLHYRSTINGFTTISTETDAGRLHPLPSNELKSILYVFLKLLGNCLVKSLPETANLCTCNWSKFGVTTAGAKYRTCGTTDFLLFYDPVMVNRPHLHLPSPACLCIRHQCSTSVRCGYTVMLW